MKLTPNDLDKWRIIPRLLMLFYMIVFYQTVHWFMALEDPTMSQAGFLTAIIGAGAAWFGLYVGGKVNAPK